MPSTSAPSATTTRPGTCAPRPRRSWARPFACRASATRAAVGRHSFATFFISCSSSAILNPAALPETPSSSDPGGNAVTGESWRPFLLATLIGAALSGALLWGQQRTPDAGLAWFLPVAIYYMLAFLLLLQYFAECGSLRE